MLTMRWPASVLGWALLLWSLAAAADSTIWEVETGRGALYLAGSIHVLRPGDYPLPPEFEAAYAGADRLVFETDLAALGPVQLQQLISTRGRYAAGQGGLREHLEPGTYRRLERFCRERGLALAPFERMKPWALALTLTAMELDALGFSGESGVDAHLYRRAIADGKAVAGLETPEEHLAALAALDHGLDEAMMTDFLQEMEALPSLLEALVAAWKRGDEAALARITSEEFPPEAVVVEEALLQDRNRRWARTLQQLADSGEDTLVVVGSAHLVGEDSVVALLRDRGFTVRKMRVSPNDTADARL